MQRSLKSSLLFIAVALVVAACPKKEPAPAPPPPEVTSTPVASTEDVTPPPQISPVQDPSPFDDPDMNKLNQHVASQGLLGDIYFDFDRDELKPDARERLSKNADFLKSRPEYMLIVEGHCDERGTNDYNLALGERRAAAARDYLVSLGVDAGRLRTISYGEERPQCAQSAESCWSLNRRAHFVITGRTNVG